MDYNLQMNESEKFQIEFKVIAFVLVHTLLLKKDNNFNLIFTLQAPTSRYEWFLQILSPDGTAHIVKS